MRYKGFFLVFFFFNFFYCYCQKIDDSFKDKNFEELKRVFYDNLNNKKYARKIAEYTLKKSKLERNTRAISNSFFRIYSTYFNDIKKGKVYLDSSIYISTKYKHHDLLAESYFYRGNLFDIHGKDELSLSDYLNARKFAKKGSKVYYKVMYNIGVRKLRIGDSKDALNIFKECYDYDLLKEKNFNDKYDHLETLYGLSIAYINNDMLDSATIFTNKGYKLAKSLKDSIYLRFSYVEGNNQYIKGKLKVAEDSLLKSIPYLIKTNDFTNLSIAYTNLGDIYFKTNRTKQMINTYLKIDSIFDDRHYIYPSAISVYGKLIQYYENQNDIEKQAYYSKRFLKIDSVLKQRYRLFSKSLYKDFDSQSIRLEKKELEAKHNKSISTFTFVIILISSILIFAIIVSLYYMQKQKEYKEKFLKLVKNDYQIKSNEKTKPKIDFPVNDKIVQSTLSYLDEFEKDLSFLNKGIALNDLAKQCNTNSKYLSKIINKFKKTSFRNYLNNLRIDYAVRRLKEDPNFRKYTVSAVADEVGFSNRESYAKAFVKRTGIHTSYFIKKLQDVNNNIDEN